MGLDGFLSFVRQKYPNVITEDHISKYANQFVFFDIASYMYKYICIFGSEDGRWLNAMLNLFLLFKNNKLNVITVFDGKPPEQKKDEISERKEKRNKIKEKIKSLETCIQKYNNEEEFTKEEIELLKDILKKIADKMVTTKLKKLLSFSRPNQPEPGTNFPEPEQEQFKLDDKDAEDIRNYISSLEKQMVYIGEKDQVHLKDLLHILGIPFVVSPSESEGYCCSMIKQGLGSAIISCDSDCFSHGAHEVVLSIDVQSGMITYANLDELLSSMELTQFQFIDFGILIGCDYNKKNKLPKVGPVKALDLIKRYGSIDNIEGYDISILKHEEIRKLFNLEYPPMKKIKQRQIDENALYAFIDEHNLKVGYDRIKQAIIKKKEKLELVFEE
jgi:5'-3' exonuclease